jgi:putative SOS response-associated peptidase YedK
LLKLGEVAPSQISVILANSKSMKQAPFLMKWGYSQNRGGLIINARSETVTEKPMFKESVHTRRCMIPANRYFEWQTLEGRKQSIRFSQKIMPSFSWPVFIVRRGLPAYPAL